MNYKIKKIREHYRKKMQAHEHAHKLSQQAALAAYDHAPSDDTEYRRMMEQLKDDLRSGLIPVTEGRRILQNLNAARSHLSKSLEPAELATRLFDKFQKIRDERFKVETTHPKNDFHRTTLQARKQKLNLQEQRLLEAWQEIDNMVGDHAPGRSNKPIDHTKLTNYSELLKD